MPEPINLEIDYLYASHIKNGLIYVELLKPRGDINDDIWDKLNKACELQIEVIVNLHEHVNNIIDPPLTLQNGRYLIKKINYPYTNLKKTLYDECVMLELYDLVYPDERRTAINDLSLFGIYEASGDEGNEILISEYEWVYQLNSTLIVEGTVYPQGAILTNMGHMLSDHEEHALRFVGACSKLHPDEVIGEPPQIIIQDPLPAHVDYVPPKYR